jgi:hypothetical protein
LVFVTRYRRGVLDDATLTTCQDARRKACGDFEAEILSRVVAYDALGGSALAPSATVIAGPLAEAFGTTPVLAVSGALVLVLPVLVLLQPEVRRMRRKP